MRCVHPCVIQAGHEQVHRHVIASQYGAIDWCHVLRLELVEYLDKAIGKYSQSGRCWWGYRINYDAYASDEESSD